MEPENSYNLFTEEAHVSGGMSVDMKFNTLAMK